MGISTPEPGIYPGVSYDEYSSWHAVRASTLNKVAKSLKKARDAEINPKEDTPALAFGTALHTAILEPQRFNDEYIVAPSCGKNTNKGRAEWEIFIERTKGKTPITQDEYDTAQHLISAVYEHEDAAELLANASDGRARELSIVWTDESTGLPCKARIDMVTVFDGDTFIVDIKSTFDASHNSFQRQMTNYGYYRSLAWYRLGLNVIAPAERRCALLAIEKTRPYDVAPYEIEEDALQTGEREMKEYLKRYNLSVKTGMWPGCASKMRKLGLPPWKMKEHEHELDNAA